MLGRYSSTRFAWRRLRLGGPRRSTRADGLHSQHGSARWDACALPPPLVRAWRRPIHADLGIGAGAFVPAYCTAIGKALLASLSAPDWREAIAELELKSRGPNTITKKGYPAEELLAIHAAGIYLEAPSSHLDAKAAGTEIELTSGRTAWVLSRVDILLDRLDEFQATGHEMPAQQAIFMIAGLSEEQIARAEPSRTRTRSHEDPSGSPRDSHRSRGRRRAARQR